MARPKREPTPYLALGTVDDPATPVPVSGITSLALTINHLDVPDRGPAEIEIRCPRGDWTWRVRVEPEAHRFHIHWDETTDAIGAFNRGRMVFSHPGCSARSETTANELRRIVQDAYIARRDSAQLP
jgi:hypothetical protein